METPHRPSELSPCGVLDGRRVYRTKDRRTVAAALLNEWPGRWLVEFYRDHAHFTKPIVILRAACFENAQQLVDWYYWAEGGESE